jgi:hypothetical protein
MYLAFTVLPDVSSFGLIKQFTPPPGFASLTLEDMQHWGNEGGLGQVQAGVPRHESAPGLLATGKDDIYSTLFFLTVT